jgi:4-hydroxy-2-oxoglutarate aldolase
MRHHAIVSSNHDLLFLKSSRLLIITSSCGNIGKVSRITSLLDGSFKILAGFIDFLLPAVSIGSAGAISPLPNIAPVSDVCSNVTSKIFTTSIGVAMELWRATQSLDSATDWSKAWPKQNC